MPNAAIVGRVAVKVIPDTSTFADDAKVKIDRIEKRLKVAVQTTIDMTGAKRDLVVKLREFNRTSKENSAYKVKLFTKIDMTGARTELNKAIREYNAIAKAEGKQVKLNTDLVAGDLKLQLSEENLREVELQIRHWRNKISPVKVQVTLGLDRAREELTSGRLAILSRARDVRLKPILDKGAVAKVGTALAALSGARSLTHNFEELGNALKNLDKSIPFITAVGTAVMGISAAALTSISNIVGLIGSLASIAPLALVLPGIFAGIGVGLGITLSALKDMKKVLPDVYNQFLTMKRTISKNFWAGATTGIRELATVFLPKLGTVATQIGKFWGTLAHEISKPFHTALGPMFDNLSKSIKITSGNSAVFASIITTLGLQGSQYLPRLAEWFNRISKQFNDFITQAAKDGSLKRWVDTALSALHQLGQVFKGLFGVVSGLAKAALASGGSTLGSLATTLKHLSDVINSANFQKTLVGVFSAAQDMLSRIWKTAGPAIIKVFQALGRTFQLLAPLFGDTIGLIVKTITDLVANPAVQRGLLNLFSGIATGLEALAPAVTALAPALGALGNLIGDIAASFGPLFAAALTAVGNALAILLPALGPVVKVLSGALTSIIKTLGPALKTLATSLATVLPAIAKTLGPVFAALAPIIGSVATLIVNFVKQALPILASALQTIAPALQTFLTALGTALTQLTPAITQALITLLQALAKPEMTKAISDLLVSFAQLLPPLTQLLVILLPLAAQLATVINKQTLIALQALNLAIKVVVGILYVLSATVASIVNSIKTSLNANITNWSNTWTRMSVILGGWISSAISAVAGFCSSVVGFFSRLPAQLGGWVVTAWNAVTTGFHGGIDRAIASLGGFAISVYNFFANTLPSYIIMAASSLPGLLIKAGESLLGGLIQGIENKIPGLHSVLGFVTSLIPKWKGPPGKDKVLLYDAGQLVMNGFINGLESQYDAVRKSLSNLTKDIGGMNMGSPMVNVGANLSAASGSVGDGSASSSSRTFIYNAAPGSSIGSQEDLFAAVGRSRFAW